MTVKFLLVDDVPENLVALEALLRRQGLEIHRATSGRDALELLLVHDYALALLDVHMPDMDGFELAELMRGTERTRHVPIIFVTASPEDPYRMFQGYDAGAVDFLFKPIDSRILQHKAHTFFELARQREELERLADQLTETLRLNETFLAAISHDLRNPLNVIVLASGMLRSCELDEQPALLVERIRSSGRRMNAMIDELSDFARARLAGGVEIVKASMDLGPALALVIDELETAHPNRVIRVESLGDTRGDWDLERITRVMSNLLNNALLYGTRSEAVVVKLDGTAPDDVVVSVWNGGSIESQARDRLFEPFQRGREGKKTTGGLGLGLYIVREVVAAHGGTVRVESDERTGTTFVVRLPRRGER